MNFLFKAYCRTYQGFMRFATKFMKFREPETLEGLPALAEKVKSEGLTSVLIVTDDVLHNKLRILEGLKEDLADKDIKFVVYDKVLPNPDVTLVEEGYSLYKENNCQGIIAVGGGSPMDCAKAVGCRVARPNKTIQQLQGYIKVRKKLPPLFAVPTTAGTGSETTVAAVISDHANNTKCAVNDPVLIPKYAVLDPTLTVKLPPHITSTTGMDALTHAVEAYIGHSNTANTRDKAVRCTKLVFENLERVYFDGTDVKRRRNMQYAAYYGGIAFTRAYVGNVHALAHKLGGKYNTPHGLANAVLLPYVLDYYGRTAEVALAELATAVGIRGVDSAAKARLFIAAIRKMNEDMNIPSVIEIKKTDINGQEVDLEKDIEFLAEQAFKEANPAYPVPKIMSKEDMKEIYRKVIRIKED